MMKTFTVCLSLAIFILAAACKKEPGGKGIYRQIQRDFERGNLKSARSLADSLKNVCPVEKELIRKADSLSQIAERLYIDFSLTEEQVRESLGKARVDYSEDEKKMWEG
ncbi:MAG: hypothetical protein KFF49_09080, partial [Bacteroidales bacterium]|nr:hypothetical protein [Bacteroidales bacterium]